jgi:3'-phosphoadenosine 5'-phosphosulfate sulfotransferase (PAPS reductase)/FAD synthetase
MSSRQKVIMFSGGRTSGYMLNVLSKRDDFNSFLVCFANTGKERAETLDFVNNISINWGIKIHWLEYRHVPAKEIPFVFPTERKNNNLAKKIENKESWHWFEEVNYEVASRDGRPFSELIGWGESVPNPVGRYCTTQMKIRTVERYLYSLGIKEYAPYIGIRKDEEDRKTSILATCQTNEFPEFPLVDENIDEEDVMSFWGKQDFDLQLESYQGNCDMCFLKSIHKLVRIAKEKPSLIKWWEDQENKKLKETKSKKASVFKLNYPMKVIRFMATQKDMFLPDEGDLACNCVESGFNRRGDDDL